MCLHVPKLKITYYSADFKNKLGLGASHHTINYGEAPEKKNKS